MGTKGIRYLKAVAIVLALLSYQSTSGISFRHMRPTVLLLGSTGTNGKLVLRGLVERGCLVRAIARDAANLGDYTSHAAVSVIEGSFLDMSPDVFRSHVEGCNAVISCLGHNLNFKGLYRDPPLCTEAAKMVCAAAESLKHPIKFVLHSSAGCDNPNGGDPKRGVGERLLISLIRLLAPPHPDNESAANFLGTHAPDSVEWCVVRPDDLIHGDVSEYQLSETLLNGLFDAKTTTRRNVADFMCRLVTEDQCWQKWRGKMPMIVDVQQKRSGAVRGQ